MANAQMKSSALAVNSPFGCFYLSCRLASVTEGKAAGGTFCEAA